MDEKEIKRLTDKHMFTALSATAGVVVLAAVIVALVGGMDKNACWSALAVAYFFCIAETVIVGKIWKWLATDKKELLPTFYTALSSFRMIAALAVLFIIYLCVGRDGMLPYFIVFVVFYFFLLILHSLFFKKMTEKML